MNKNIRIESPIMKYKLEVFGLAAIMIIYHHLGNRGIPGLSFFPSLIQNIVSFVVSKGSLGVDVFFFLSAIGLYFSMKNNNVGNFYINRIKRTFVPWLVIMTPVFIYEDCILDTDGIVGFLLDVTTLRFWVDNSNTNTPWFVPCIIIVYVVFPLIFKLDKITKHYSSLGLFIFFIVSSILVNGIQGIAGTTYLNLIARMPVFMFGVLIAAYLENHKCISKIIVITVFVVTFAIYVVWYFVDLTLALDFLIGSIIAVGLVVSYSYFREIVKPCFVFKLFSLFGTISLESYLVHTVLLRPIDRIGVSDLFFASMYIAMPVGTFFISKGCAYIVKQINKFMFRKR